MEEKLFSQNKDELIINKYLKKDPNKVIGTYVDIGACDPNFLSNTKYYYLRGWKGLEVDAYPSIEEKFKKERPLDTFIRVAITDYIGECQMYGRAIENSMVGKRYKQTYGTTELYTVKCITMDKLIEMHPTFREPDFMSMDIETNEEKALSKCNFNIFKPYIIDIEFPGEGIDHRTLWEKYLLPYYNFKEILNNNAFYVRKEEK